MTGIFGCFGRDLGENIVRSMMCEMKREGYGIKGLFRNDSCLLGKLDIRSIDAKVHIKSEDKVIIVTYGEIYDDKEMNIDKSIRILYDDGRLELLKDLNGSFAAAIYDISKEKVTLVNDRYGLIKLFYYRDADRFYFSPKIKPLLDVGVKKTLRKDAIIDFFLFGYLLGDKTFFKNLYQLPPASILEASQDSMKLIKYWDYEYREEYDTKSREVLMDELHAFWQRAIERRVKKDEKIIIPLSGGLDSRAILAAALRCTPKENIITFSFGEKGSYDFEIGKMVAEKAGVKNIPLKVEKENFEQQYDTFFGDHEGMIDATPYFTVNGYKRMEKFAEEIFSGTMIDVFLGRHVLSNIFSPDILNKEILSEDDYIEIKDIIFENQKLNDEEELLHLLKTDFLGNMDIKSSFDMTHKKFEEIENRSFPNYFAVWDYTNRWDKYIYFAVLCYRNQFRYHTMLDRDLVDFTLKLPPELRLDENLYKQMLVMNYPDLFELPTKTNYGLRLNAGNISLFLRKAILFSKVKANKISNMLIRRNFFHDKNKNYIDYDDLLRNNEEYQNYMRKMIERVREREYFNKEHVDKIWRLHMRGRSNFSMLLGLLVTFELFLERFVDE